VTTLAVDARALHGSGIGRYIRETVAGIARRGRFTRLRLVGARRELEAFVATLGDGTPTEIVPIRGGRYSPLAQVEWRRLLRGAPLGDVYFFPHSDVPLLGLPPRSVVTVHDLILLRVPHATAPARRIVARLMLARAVRDAAALITVSAFTRDDLLRSFPQAAGRTTAISLAAADVFSTTRPAASALPVGLRTPYLLCVANRKPHKNIEAALQVLAALRPQYPSLRLAIAGERFSTWKSSVALARTLGIEAQVIDLDPLDEATLHAVYAHASVLLVPSRYEGFGLPVLEGMASGTPVVASNATSIPEVAGDAALLFAPDDTAGMTGAVAAILTDRVLQTKMSAAGRAQAARFSWAQTAEATEQVLLRVAAS
jgi:glycosyltransferase involved in cell wall biosynthesis